jgi:hypothetical protein
MSSLLVPGGLVARAPRPRDDYAISAEEITRMRSLARVLVAGVPAIAWLTYRSRSLRRCRDSCRPRRVRLRRHVTTVSILAIGLAWTIAARTRGPHDILVGTWVVPPMDVSAEIAEIAEKSVPRRGGRGARERGGQDGCRPFGRHSDREEATNTSARRRQPGVRVRGFLSIRAARSAGHPASALCASLPLCPPLRET